MLPLIQNLMSSGDVRPRVPEQIDDVAGQVTALHTVLGRVCSGKLGANTIAEGLLSPRSRLGLARGDPALR
jgi:hypothetical protein